ncbi:MAG: pilus assembly protein PilM [Myxococcales bacterium]|nr:pilus assembly protein PilM [Myxococcales bacterium]
MRSTPQARKLNIVYHTDTTTFFDTRPFRPKNRRRWFLQFEYGARRVTPLGGATLASKNLLGVDIGSHTIKVVEISQTKKNVELLRFGVAELPSDAIVDGAFVNFPVVVERLRELLRKHKFKQKRCALAISGTAVIVKKISLPQMTEDELQESVQWEAEQYIPFDIKDVNVDVEVLNQHPGQGQMDVLLVAAKKQVINDHVAVARDAGLSPTVMDVTTFTAQNCLELNYGNFPNEVVALVNIGASSINLNVLADGTTAFTRDILVGSSVITEEIQKRFNLPWDEAERYKTRTPDQLPNQSLAREIKKLVKRVSDTLATELQRSLDFFAATTANMQIAKVYLSGGGAMNPELVSVISDRLALPTEIVNPFQNITINPKFVDLELLRHHAAQPAVAVGLALRRQDEQ